MVPLLILVMFCSNRDVSAPQSSAHCSEISLTGHCREIASWLPALGTEAVLEQWAQMSRAPQVQLIWSCTCSMERLGHGSQVPVDFWCVLWTQSSPALAPISRPGDSPAPPFMDHGCAPLLRRQVGNGDRRSALSWSCDFGQFIKTSECKRNYMWAGLVQCLPNVPIKGFLLIHPHDPA